MTGGSMDIEDKNVSKKSAKLYTIIFSVLGIVFVILGHLTNSTFAKAIGHLAIISLGLMWLYHLKLYQWTQDFQHNFFPKMEDKYKNFLAKILTGKKLGFLWQE